MAISLDYIRVMVSRGNDGWTHQYHQRDSVVMPIIRTSVRLTALDLVRKSREHLCQINNAIYDPKYASGNYTRKDFLRECRQERASIRRRIKKSLEEK